MIDIMTSPWKDSFEDFLAGCRKSLVVCSPFISQQACCWLTETIEVSLRSRLSLLLLTNLSRENMLSGATDVRGIIRLYEVFPKTDVRFLPNLHAKIYVSDEQAIVTSANLTNGGLVRNLEYGLRIFEVPIVDRIRSDATAMHAIGTTIDLVQLKLFESIVGELAELRKQNEKVAKSALRRAFDDKLRAADEEVLRVRATSMSAHVGFAQSILFILSNKGPCDTKQMYREIESLHPDLCDDSIKLVIRGERWSQAKWKHRVRHAQQFLSRQEKIIRVNGRWQLT